MLNEPLNTKLSFACILIETFGLIELSDSNFSYLTAPLSSTLSEACLAASAKIAYADLLALVSIPPPKNIKSAGTARFPFASKPAIESSFLATS